MPLTKISSDKKAHWTHKSIGVEGIEIKDYAARESVRECMRHNENGMLYF